MDLGFVNHSLCCQMRECWSSRNNYITHVRSYRTKEEHGFLRKEASTWDQAWKTVFPSKNSHLSQKLNWILSQEWGSVRTEKLYSETSTFACFAEDFRYFGAMKNSRAHIYFRKLICLFHPTSPHDSHICRLSATTKFGPKVNSFSDAYAKRMPRPPVLIMKMDLTALLNLVEDTMKLILFCSAYISLSISF